MTQPLQYPANEKENARTVEDINQPDAELPLSNIDGSETATFQGTAENARQATVAEHELTLLQSVRSHWKAVGWSVLVCMGNVMDGYDSSIVGSFAALPSFQKKYGVPFDGGYQLTVSWQAALGIGSSVGTILGMWSTGYLNDRFGHKCIMLAGYVFVTLAIFSQFFAPSVGILLLGRILQGIPVGVFTSSSAAYVSEVCPTVLRGCVFTYVNMSGSIGNLVSSGVLAGFVNRTDQWGYRIPFAIQWAWSVPLLCITCFMPESPWFLVRKGRFEAAERSLRRSSNKSANEIKNTVAMMIHTQNTEQIIKVGGGSYLDCLKGTNLRRTEIALGVFTSAALSGFAVGGTYFFEQVGLSASSSFDLNVGYSCLSVVGALVSLPIIANFGRRTIYLYGLGSMTVIMFCIGIVSVAAGVSGAAAWAQAGLSLLWVSIQAITLYAMTGLIAAEVSATRLRIKAYSLSRELFNLLNLVISVAGPYELNPSGSANWQGKAAFLPAGLSVLCWIWVFFRLPETKGRTYEELDLLFEKRVSARKFKGSIVDPYAENNGLGVEDNSKWEQ